MRPEKQNLTKEYLTRLNASPFFIVVDYKGLKVGHMTELRKRLNKAGAEVHVVKNSVFRIAAKEAGVGELNGALAGQIAVVTGQKDISSAAKVVKTFGSEFDRLKVKVGGTTLDLDVVLEPLHQLERAGPGRAARAVGHRDVRGPERPERLVRLEERTLPVVRLGGEELEGEDGLAALAREPQEIADLHAGRD